jgi:predicted nucleic acid-binding protein
MANFTVLYDSCVLYPAPLRDLLMWLSLSDLFRARWSNDIHEEWIVNLLEARPDLTRERLERTRDMMNANVRDCLVTGYEPLIDGLTLPDPDDRHVLAAAIRAGAAVIVTFNLKDFPSEFLAPFSVEAQHPDEFIVHLIDLNPGLVLNFVTRCWMSLKNPPKTADEYLDTLLRQGLPETVAGLRALGFGTESQL